MNITKICTKCGEIKSLDEFHNNKYGKYGKRADCKKCNNKMTLRYHYEHRKERNERHRKYYKEVDRKRRNHKSMSENKSCTIYLGVFIGERLCRHLFKDVQMMPYRNVGFDMICNRGKKIDVKSACITLNNGKNIHWDFHIKKNKIADYFILVAFDNRTDLNVLHMWMIPGKDVNDKGKIQISPSTIHKWDKWKRDINDVQLCCIKMKKVEYIHKKSSEKENNH